MSQFHFENYITVSEVSINSLKKIMSQEYILLVYKYVILISW